MDDTTLQRILQALERIEAELKARRPADPFPPSPPPPPRPHYAPPAWPQPRSPYYEPYWLDGQPHQPRDGRPFDPFIVTC